MTDQITAHAYYQGDRDDSCTTCGKRATEHERIGVCTYPSVAECPRSTDCLLEHDSTGRGEEPATAEEPAPPGYTVEAWAYEQKTRDKPADAVIISRPLAEALDELCAELIALERADAMPYGLTVAWPNVKALLPEGVLAGGEGAA